MRDADVIVIGAGPGGLAAAAAAGAKGASVIVIEREERTGGILNQCIHDGFGLVRYGAQLSGPEYAARSREEVRLNKVSIFTDAMVTGISRSKDGIHVTALSKDGIKKYVSGSAVLATGCRERTRGMISIPGSRPAGIFTAGTAQNLINRKNVMVGRRVVILGTGDIGLIMARRLTLEGADVICAIEMKEEPQGLARNVRQCLQDFDIPIFLSHTVTDIKGKRRLESVTMAQVDEKGSPISGTETEIKCDTLILSVGLIPENEIAQTAGVALQKDTNRIITDEFLMTSVPGIFACGNCKGIMDLADYVSEEGEVAGENAAAYSLHGELRESRVKGTGNSPKGMPEEGVITCIFCPKGCRLHVDREGGVSGNGCSRGIEFAALERTDPHRILTTTVRIKGRRELLPVRSSGYLPLHKIPSLVRELRSVNAQLPIKAGQVVASFDIADGVDIISQCDWDGRNL